MPKLSMPGALLVGDAGGIVDTGPLKGVHHCIKSGILAAEAIYAALKAGSNDFSRLRAGRGRVARSAGSSGRCATRASRSRRASSAADRWSTCDRHQRPLPRRALALAPQRRQADVHRQDARRAIRSPTASTSSTSSRRVYISGNATRDDAPNHIRVQTNVPREIAETWRGCARPASTRSPRTRPRTGHVDVIVNYTNCVQCGAITAKGGRLTTPEGGDGPAVPEHLSHSPDIVARGCPPAAPSFLP